jgi:hypothetical protein
MASSGVRQLGLHVQDLDLAALRARPRQRGVENPPGAVAELGARGVDAAEEAVVRAEPENDDAV